MKTVVRTKIRLDSKTIFPLNKKLVKVLALVHVDS